MGECRARARARRPRGLTLGSVRSIGQALKLAQGSMEPCPAGCGEVGTWGGEPCPDCHAKTERADWGRALLACGVPPEYHDVPATLALPPRLQEWKGKPWAVTLLGNTGTGKTWLAVRLLAGLYVAGWDGCFFADAAVALDLMRAEIDTPRDGKTFERLAGARALLLDDITGPTRNTEWERDRLVLLLRTRHMHQRATIVTGNKKTLAELAEERLDGPIGSRLGLGPWFEIEGRDRRLPRRKQ